MFFSVRHRSGMTLIMVAGVLAVLAAMSAGFYTLMMMQSRAASNYDDASHASLMAQAGLYDAISRLQEQAFYKTEDPSDPWFTVDYLNGGRKRISFETKLDPSSTSVYPRHPFSRSLSNRTGDYSDRYVLNVSDASGKINVNAGDNLGVLLDNLCRVVGPPLVASNLDALQPRRWATEGAAKGLFDNAQNKQDQSSRWDLYYQLHADGRPLMDANNRAVYGDGYAIAGYRARYGRFKRLEDVKNALTTGSHPDHPELEQLEREIKFNILREYVTIDSWVDTNTVCVGKFEWADYYRCIDRDKSWVASVDENYRHIEDPQNTRGSLVGCYLSIVNGHGAGQLRRIKENGIDWLELEEPFVIVPGPISSYMIIGRENARLDPKREPELDLSGHFIEDPNIDYKRYPLCIHRAPVNVNTASDKVLAALFLGINVEHGTPLALGTECDAVKTRNAWMVPNSLFGRIPSPAGLKRIPASSGMLVLDRPEPWSDKDAFGYINNNGTLGSPDFLLRGGKCNEAHELAYRIIVARQRRIDPVTGQPLKLDIDPFSKLPRGPLKSWDDLFFRVIQPWDQERLGSSSGTPGLNTGTKLALAPMLMAHFNANTDILKFNPNIEWIDRWGRNFTAMEPIMIFKSGEPERASPVEVSSAPPIPGMPLNTFYYIRNMRYKFDEMIDKTDLNRSTTEFSFDCGGIFEIHSTGQVMRNGTLLAEQQFEALVQVYDVWRESTQRQFVEGHFSNAARKNRNGSSAGFTDAGKITRDADNINEFKALDTLPEPLVPFKYRLQPVKGAYLRECVSDKICDAHGNEKKDPLVPDIIANKVVPAGYDGQLVLAANTEVYDNKGHGDTFLASFNGDLDTDTCVANGREQAKTPLNPDMRVCDTISLLGLLNDTEIDLDPDSYPVFNLGLSSTAKSAGMKGLPNDGHYEYALTSRMGDLRADGVFLGVIGTSCKDATLKYAFGEGPSGQGDKKLIAAGKGAAGPSSNLRNMNYPIAAKTDPGNTASTAGMTISMWYKSAWHATDHLEHEFFNAGSNGTSSNSRGNKLCKNGYLRGPIDKSTNPPTTVAWPFQDNTLWTCMEEYNGQGVAVALHGGRDNVTVANLPPNQLTETPSFYCQPFRWGFVGAVYQYGNKAKYQLGHAEIRDPKKTDYHAFFDGYKYGIYYDDTFGFWQDKVHADGVDAIARSIIRPFISTARYPEGATLRTDNNFAVVNLYPKASEANTRIDNNTVLFEVDLIANADGGLKAIGSGTLGTVYDLDGQPAAYTWAKAKSARSLEGCFSINNVNQGNAPNPPPIPPPPPPPPRPPTPPAPPPPPAPPGPPAPPPPPPPPVPRPPGNRTFQPVGMQRFSGTLPYASILDDTNAIYLADGDDKPVIFADVNAPFGTGPYCHIYRTAPADSSYSTIDELKISKRRWTSIEIGDEMTLSRYYLPGKTSIPGQLPTFTSQSLLQWAHGFHALKSDDRVTPARVTWSVFTPRFMHEYKVPRYQHAQVVGGKITQVYFRGPFDYAQYNCDIDYDAGCGWKNDNFNKPNDFLRVDRIPPKAGEQSHYSRGVEVVLVKYGGNSPGASAGAVELPCFVQDAPDRSFQRVNAFTDPEAVNGFLDPAKLGVTENLKADELHYRVRFRFPVDTKVDPLAGSDTVDPQKHYLLDTPVFDDISIVYIHTPRFLYFKHSVE